MNEQLHHLSIDLETYSKVSIGKAGSYRYILDPSFEILLFAFGGLHLEKPGHGDAAHESTRLATQTNPQGFGDVEAGSA